MLRSSLAFFSLLVVLVFGVRAYADEADFTNWVVNFKAEAVRQGISSPVVDGALNGLSVDDSVIELDQKQPENKITLEKYLHNTINQRRINKGRDLLEQYAGPLKRIGKQYGVQPKYILALYGIESDYGQHPGDYSVVRSLATLAYEGRRAEFFSAELMNALRILENQGIPSEQMTGSWAGAMGGCQFMPSTYLAYAADGDGDGKRDIWDNPLDVFASIANYLHGLGWDGRQDLGPLQMTITPDNFNSGDTSIMNGHAGEYWGKQGFSVGDGNGHMSRVLGSHTLYAIYLGKSDEENGTVSLVSENFKALLNWNRSRYFATAVGTLADAIGDDE